MIGASLELGGKNPAIICRDADLAGAAQGTVLGAFTNSGQMCIHLERVYIDSKVYKDYVELLVNAVKALKLGQSYDYDADMGCLVSADQLAVVEAHVADAVARARAFWSAGVGARISGRLRMSPRCSRASPPRCRSMPRKPSVRCSRSTPSAPRMRPFRGPTTPSMA